MATAANVDAYLAALPDHKRGALERLRRRIRDATPEATEGMAYGMPAYRLRGRYFVGFGATKAACSFYAGRAPVDACRAQLAPWRAWKGTINFLPDQPLPDELVDRLLAVRLEEFAATEAR